MRIAVLSGKGGTGKTLVSVNLASVAGECFYMDCDVEEPNGHLFFKPKEVKEQEISVSIPVFNDTKCNGCRKCVDFCKFNALAYIKDRVFVFEEVCHSCGGCTLLCPQNAISEKQKMIGKLQIGQSEKVTVNTGMMNTGEVSGVPIINKMIKDNKGQKEAMTFIDCPPGSACIVMESIKDADFCILVAEPTVFGVHNLSMVYELVKLFDKPYGVVLNKCMDTENPAEVFCLEKNIPILGRISFDKELGTLNSNAKIAAREKDDYRSLFSSLLQKVMEEVAHETTVNSKR
ncbi:MAG: ATP-binding protein [Anaerovorax sp.]|nr:ATP-binding protein [Anaerovorax sp.]